jgi:tRNA-(ms[2]io[6]A)-hydroxylase
MALVSRGIDDVGHDEWAPFCHGRGVTDNKRRLPVVQPKLEDEGEPRPAWHWVGFGAVAIFVAWLPLAAIAEAIGRRLVRGRVGSEVALADLSRSERFKALAMIALPQAVALALASMAGGFLVTRFGTGTKARDAAFAGACVGLLALGLTFAQAGFSLAAFIVPILATAFAALGGRLGLRRSL